MVNFPPPNLIGAPIKYDKWRNMQAEAVLAATDSTKRFIVQCAPTGFGKSLVYVSQAILTSARAVILTSTKALQSQLYGDFAESGLIEIKGLNAYECIEGDSAGRFGDFRREGFRADRGMPMACDEAPCQSGAFCPRREGGCFYYDAYRKACNPDSKLIVTNYAYWMSIHKWGEGLGNVDLLILDEAHSALDELGGFIGTELRQAEIESVLPTLDGGATLLQPGADVLDWVSWASFWVGRANNELDRIKAAIKESERTGTNKTGERVNFGALRRARDLRRLTSKLDTIAGMKGDWIVDWTEDRHRHPVVKFDPVWPGAYAEKNLFLGVPKVVMVSATVRPETAHMLDIKPQDMDFREYPSSFPVKNRPIIYLPTAQMNRNSEKDSITEITKRSDQIIGRRLDRKGLIQTVSYQRARTIYLNSEYRSRMLIHDPSNTRDIIEQFKKSKDPLILISPVLGTGYDFPYDQAEFQILIKVPFPVTTNKVVKARVDRSPKYKDFITSIELVQMAGRIVRAEDDTGETFILDSDFGWWYFGARNNGKGLCPKWFVDAVREEKTLGPALPKLRRKG
jgi:Rad3-related DNA helicase